MNIEEIREFGKQGSGKTLLLKHLEGGSLTRKESMLAMCYDCTCGYADGRVDCKTPNCPLYDYMPYNKNKKVRKVFTSEQKKAFVERMKKSRAK